MLLNEHKLEVRESAFERQTFNNEEAAVILKVSIRTLQKYRNQGLIEFSQVGRKIVYTGQQILDFLERNKRRLYNLQTRKRHGG